MLIAVVVALAQAALHAGGQTTVAPTHDVELVAHATPAQLEARERVSVRLTLRNAGTSVWDPSLGMAVAYHWMDRTGATVLRDGERTPLPKTVVPGADVELEATLAAPARDGELLLQWDVVHEHVCWLSEIDPTPVAPVRVKIRPAPVTHAFSRSAGRLPRVLVAGRTTDVRLEVTNDGAQAWSADAPIAVSYHWIDRSGREVVFEGLRSRVATSVASSASAVVELKVRAPATLGWYRLRLDMVHDGVCWFADFDPTPEPLHGVLVLPNPLANARGATWGALLLAALTVVVARGRRCPGWVVGVFSVADVVWLVLSLVVKQGQVLVEAGRFAARGYFGIVLSGAAVLALLALALPRRWRPPAVWATAAAAAVVIFVDIVYLRFFDDVLSLAVIGAAGQTGQIARSIVSLLQVRDLWLVADLLPGLVLILAVQRLEPKTGRWPVRFCALALVPALAPGAAAAWRIAHAKGGRYVQVFQNLFLVEELGILNYHLWDLSVQVKERLHRPALDDVERAQIESWFATRAPQRAGVGPWFGAAAGRNLLLLQVESLQGYVVGLQIEGQEITPNLNAWRRHALWFSACTDQTAQGRTSDAELAVQTSILPPAAGAAVFRFGGNDFTGIGEILAEQDYATLSAVPFRSAFWNRRVTHRAFGYASNLFDHDFEPGPVIGWGLNDRDFLAQMAPRLEAMPEPFAVSLITLSNHHPFEGFPTSERELRLGRWEGTPFGNYLHTMRFFDRAVGELAERLAASGLLQRTVVVIFGDHSSGMTWRAELAEAIGSPFTEAEYYVQDRVPLLIHVPGQSQLVGERPVRCGHLDIAPTVLALLGTDPAPWALMGRNLLGDPGPGPVVRRYGSWLDDGVIYANKGEGWQRGVCYEARSREVLPVAECRALDEAAAMQLRVARLVLTHDLQQELRERLVGSAFPGS